jgi:hypothetical protein
VAKLVVALALVARQVWAVKPALAARPVWRARADSVLAVRTSVHSAALVLRLV